MALAIGIDLGTANTRVSVYRDGHIETIPDEGCPSIPSYVAFTDTQRLVGAAAKKQASINPRNTVFDVMRLVEREFTNQRLQADMRHFPFKVIGNPRNKPLISVEYKRDTKELTPEEVISMVLSRAKESAERYLEQIVANVVLIVPARCSMGLRQSFKDAALISGLNVLYMVNGPTAAVSDYAVSNNSHIEGERNILAIDIGAGTTDVVLIAVEEGILEVKSVASDDHLGGDDFDNRLVNYFVNLFKRQHRKDLTSNVRSMQRLRSTCEGIKRELSSRTTIEVKIDSIYEGIDLISMLTRAKFEELCKDLFRLVIIPIERVLRDGKVDKHHIHEIIIIGGSSRIPKIQQMISVFFNGKGVNRSLNADEAAVRGAGVHAAIFSGYSCPKLNEFLLLDVLPVTLGIETPGGAMEPMIKRNTTIPTKSSEIFSTFRDNEADFWVCVYEGERVRTMDCTSLGKFSIPLPLAPRGIPQIEVTFDCDVHGTTFVTAVDRGTGRRDKLRIQCYHRLSEEAVERMQAEAASYKADDEAEAERLTARNTLESCAYSLRSELFDTKFERECLLVKKIIIWLEEHPHATMPEYRLQQAELEKISASFSSRSSPKVTEYPADQDKEPSDLHIVKVGSLEDLASPTEQSSRTLTPPAQASQASSSKAPRHTEEMHGYFSPPPMPDNDFQRPRRSPQLQPGKYTVGWICALPVELAAAQEMLDEEHEDLERDEYDDNLYSLGSVAGHNVVIVCLPSGRIGNNPAAAVASQMRATFKGIRFGLMVGIGGGVPSVKEDIRLGDVVVSHPDGTFSGVIQYDLGKLTPNGFLRTGALNSPPQILLGAVAKVRANELRDRSKLSQHVSKLERISKFRRENTGPDFLFEASYDHVAGETCNLCDTKKQKERQRRDGGAVAVHYGTIASGNQVMRDGKARDEVSSELGGVLCFEMEAAGLMNRFPCLIIRGICDYADSHKNKRWQAFAAGTAAAYAKEVLSVIPPTQVKETSTVEDTFRVPNY